MTRRGSLIFVAGSISWSIAQWYLVWLFARFAGGAVAVGEYSLALAVTTPIFIAGYFGLRTIYLTFRRRHQWDKYKKLRYLGILLSASFSLGYYLIFSAGDLWIWCALIFQKSVDAYLDLQYARIQRQNRLIHIGLLGLLKTVGTIIVASLLILTTHSVAAAVFGSGLVSGLVTLLAQRTALDRPEPEISGSANTHYREILRASIPITVAEALGAVSGYLPLLFLGVIADETIAGTFAVVAYVFSVANIVGGILRNVLITSLRLAYENQGARHLIRRGHQITLTLGLAGLIAAPVIVFAGSPIIEFLYGPEFSFSYLELTILALAAVAITPTYIYSSLLNVINLYDSQVWILLAALFCGISVGVVLVQTTEIPAMIVALSVALATYWGRFLGVLIRTLVFRRLIS